MSNESDINNTFIWFVNETSTSHHVHADRLKDVSNEIENAVVNVAFRNFCWPFSELSLVERDPKLTTDLDEFVPNRCSDLPILRRYLYLIHLILFIGLVTWITRRQRRLKTEDKATQYRLTHKSLPELNIPEMRSKGPSFLGDYLGAETFLKSTADSKPPSFDANSLSSHSLSTVASPSDTPFNRFRLKPTTIDELYGEPGSDDLPDAYSQFDSRYYAISLATGKRHLSLESYSSSTITDGIESNLSVTSTPSRESSLQEYSRCNWVRYEDCKRLHSKRLTPELEDDCHGLECGLNGNIAKRVNYRHVLRQ